MNLSGNVPVATVVVMKPDRILTVGSRYELVWKRSSSDSGSHKTRHGHRSRHCLLPCLTGYVLTEVAIWLSGNASRSLL